MRRSVNESDNRLVPEIVYTRAEDVPGRVGSQKFILIALLIGVCTLVFITHLPALWTRALFADDGQYFLNNLLVQKPSWTSVRRFITEIFEPSSVEGYYQPLTMISLMVDCVLGGSSDNLMPFHRTSLLLHVCNTALVVILLYILFGQPWIAAGVGLLFGLHPLTVEPIAWVSDRKTVLASFFALWSLVLYICFIRTGKSKAHWGCLAMYVMALMSKPTSIPLPVMMLLMDYWPLKRLNRATVIEKLPLFVVGCVFAIIIYISQSRMAGVVLPHQYSPWRVPLVVCHDIVFYLYKIIWPTDLSPYYAFPKPIALSHPAILTGVIGTCILIPLFVISLHWTRGIMTGWLFFFVAILPTMQILGFSNVIASDKFAYLPSLGFLMLLAWLMCSLHAKTVNKRSNLSCAALIMFILIVAGAEALSTRLQLRHWRNSISLYEYMLALTPDEAILHTNIGIALMKSRNKRNDAIDYFRRAVELNPQSRSYQHNLGIALLKIGQPKEAMKHLREAMCLNRHHIPVLNSMAWILATHPDPNVQNADESLKLAKKSSHLTNHRSPTVLDTLAAAWAASGHFDRAVATAKKALWVASKTNEKELAGRIRERLELYKQGKPYREDPTWPEMKSGSDVSQEQLKAKDENLKETAL